MVLIERQVEHLKSNSECIASTLDTGFPESLQCNLIVPWCNRQLSWQVRWPCGPMQPPDLIFVDDDFCPLLDPTLPPDLSQQLRTLLHSWDPGSLSQLTQLIQLLLAAYRARQLARLAAVAAASGNSRLQFELSTLPAPGEVQALLVEGSGAEAGKAVFSIPVEGLQLAQLMAIRAMMAAPGGSSSSSSSSSSTPAGAAAAGSQAQAQAPPAAPDPVFRLVATFSLSDTAGGSKPELALLVPPSLAGLGLPPLSPQLPIWTSHMCLMEFMPLVADRLQQALDGFCTAALSKAMLIPQLSELLGRPLESSPHVPGPQGGCRALFSLLQEGALLLLALELGPAFPEDKPTLTLMAVRPPGPSGGSGDSSRQYREYPWSPRWQAAEMASRIFNFLKEEAAPAFVKQLQLPAPPPKPPPQLQRQPSQHVQA